MNTDYIVNCAREYIQSYHKQSSVYIFLNVMFDQPFFNAVHHDMVFFHKVLVEKEVLPAQSALINSV